MSSVYSDESVGLELMASDDLNPVVNAMQKSLRHLLPHNTPAVCHIRRNQWHWERPQAPHHLAISSYQTLPHSS